MFASLMVEYWDAKSATVRDTSVTLRLALIACATSAPPR